MPALTTETLARLRAFDTPTICNLIELFEVRPHNTGYMDGRIRAAFPEMPPMVGFAATATFRAAPAGDAPPPLRRPPAVSPLGRCRAASLLLPLAIHRRRSRNLSSSIL